MIGNVILCFLLCCEAYSLLGRSPHRPEHPLDPTIITSWEGDKKTYQLRDVHLRQYPYFNLYDKQHIESNLLPSGPLPFRYNPKKTVLGSTLSDHIEHLLDEVRQGKTTFTNFTVLKQRDFDWKTNTGLVIVRNKEYPFVVKLSIETPQSFLDPQAKGFEPSCFFLMGGGVNRHLTGFTRIKNLNYLKKRIQESSTWNNKVHFPHKWFWLPKDNRLISITGKNLGFNQEKKVSIPAVYAIVSEYIEIERTFSMTNQHDRNIAMSLSNYLDHNIDPHINNYVIEAKTGIIVALDTEHFPVLVGYNETPPCKSYFHWYFHLAKQFFQETMLKTKQQRKQYGPPMHVPI